MQHPRQHINNHHYHHQALLHVAYDKMMIMMIINAIKHKSVRHRGWIDFEHLQSTTEIMIVSTDYRTKSCVTAPAVCSAAQTRVAQLSFRHPCSTGPIIGDISRQTPDNPRGNIIFQQLKQARQTIPVPEPKFTLPWHRPAFVAPNAASSKETCNDS